MIFYHFVLELSCVIFISFKFHAGIDRTIMLLLEIKCVLQEINLVYLMR